MGIEGLKRIEIKNEKFTLEGRAVNVNPIKLAFIEFDPKELEEDLNEDSGPSLYPEVTKATRERNEETLRKFHQDNINGINAYILGEPKVEYQSGWGSFPGNDHYTYPILYLKIIE